MKNQRNDYRGCLSAATCRRCCRQTVAVTILADRGFGDHKLFAFSTNLGFAYVIRFRGNIHVTDAAGETRAAAEWVGKAGRARKLRDARVTASHAYQVGAVVCVHAKAMKEPWCLAASNAETPAATLINHYAKALDHRAQLPRHQGSALRHGAGRDPHRRSATPRSAAAPQRVRIVLLTLLGAAGESLGMDRHAQVQHIKDAHPLAVPPGLHALRTDPDHARASAPAADGEVRGNAAQQRAVRRVSLGDEMRGRVSAKAIFSRADFGCKDLCAHR